jgi:hypothetical protein
MLKRPVKSEFEVGDRVVHKPTGYRLDVPTPANPRPITSTGGAPEGSDYDMSTVAKMAKDLWDQEIKKRGLEWLVRTTPR